MCPRCLWNLKFWCWWSHVLAVSRSLMSTKTLKSNINKRLKITMIWYQSKRAPIKGTWSSLLTRSNMIVVVHLKIVCFFWKNKKFLEQTDKLVYDVERVRLYKLWLRSWTIKQTNRSQNFQVSNRINWKCWGIKSK